MRPSAQEHLGPPGAGRGRTDGPWSLAGRWLCHMWASETWPPGRKRTNGRVLSPWLVVLCHTSHGTNTVLGAVDPHSHSQGCVS